VLPTDQSITTTRLPSSSNSTPTIASAIEQISPVCPDESAAVLPMDPPATPNILHKVKNSTKHSPYVQIDGDLDVSSSSGTPHSNGELKRRAPKSLTIPKFKKRRVAPAFDLAEDTDTEEQFRDRKARRRSIYDLAGDDRENRPRLPRLPLVHGPSAPSAATMNPSPQPTKLYLPR
jgi:hypothetical protein